jgi:hypothetical protein
MTPRVQNEIYAARKPLLLAACDPPKNMANGQKHISFCFHFFFVEQLAKWF